MHSIWFKDISNNLLFKKKSLSILVRYISSSLLKKEKFNEVFPDDIVNDTYPRIVFISVSDGNMQAKVFVGCSQGILSAINKSINKIVAFFPGNICSVKVDFVNESYNNITLDAEQIINIKYNLLGLANDDMREIVILNEEIIYNKLFHDEGVVNPSYCELYFKDKFKLFMDEVDKNTNSWSSFTTKSFYIDGDGIVELYRGHKLSSELTKKNIKCSLDKAGKYLISSIDSKGKFNYIYDPIRNQNSLQYNMLRHCGTVYSLLELYELFKDTKFLDAAVLGIQYLMDFMKPVTIKDVQTVCLIEHNAIRLGGNGLALLALAKYTKLTKDYQYKETMENLAKWIKHSQDSNGNFSIHKQSALTDEVSDYRSDYYPGEAIFALLRLYEIDSNYEWVDVSTKAVDYIINNLAEETIQNHHHWFMYSLNELYSIVPDKKYVEHSQKIANAIIDFQVKDTPSLDMIGCFGNISSTSTATRIEGLLADYKLCQKANYDSELQRIMETIKLGISFQLQTQYATESAMYFINPQWVLGAFAQSFTEPSIRIDYIQHNISALVNFYNTL